MRIFKDTRGKSWFDIFPMDKGQVDMMANYPGTIRAFHCHRIKYEIFFVIQGEFKLVLTEPDEIIYMSQGDSVRINPGRWHGYQVLGDKPGIMLEYCSSKHDMENPDDYRKPWDTFDLWKKEKK